MTRVFPRFPVFRGSSKLRTNMLVAEYGSPASVLRDFSASPQNASDSPKATTPPRRWVFSVRWSFWSFKQPSTFFW